MKLNGSELHAAKLKVISNAGSDIIGLHGWHYVKDAFPEWFDMWKEGKEEDHNLLAVYVSQAVGFEVTLEPLGNIYTSGGTISSARTIQLDGDEILFNEYGAGLVQGTPAYLVGVDVTGKIIDVPFTHETSMKIG